VQVIEAQRDALLQAQRQKDELNALIVHDLKNPLSSILSNAQYALRQAQALTDDERDSLEDIERAGQAMSRLVMNLLDVSRSDDGALVPHVTEFDVPALLGEVCKEMGHRIEDKQQRLSLVVAAAGRLRGDRDLVRRVVENLIDNAYKYGPRQGAIGVELVPATMDDGAEPAIEIRVRDEGEGIPEAYRQMVFEKYGRAGGGLRGHEARSSHGLGLVFCRRAVGVHGGAIWIEDPAAGGSCFCVRLPVGRLPLSEPARAPMHRTGPRALTAR
jgi:signal transduction histidine kinase